MNAKEARQITNQARLNSISTPEGDVQIANIKKKIASEAHREKDFVKSTILTRYAEEIKHRLVGDGYRCHHKNIDDTVSLIHVEW